MPRRSRPGLSAGPILSFGITGLLLFSLLQMDTIPKLLLSLGIAVLIAFLVRKITDGRNKTNEEASANQTSAKEQSAASAPETAKKKSYGPEIDPIIEEGNRALSEMGRLYMSIKDTDVRQKINELMRITDKITQDAIEDPKDIPQIKKFMNYYLPTTIKLLNNYDRMSSQGIEGQNLDKSMKSINEMLDVAIDAYKKRLDSLFENQALDVETDIDVLNQMLSREGLSGGKDFEIK